MKRCEARSNPRAPPSVVLEEQRLDNDIHDCAGFDCGVPALNDYLRKFASQHRRRGVSQTYVLAVDAKDEIAVEFYRRYGFTACRDALRTLYLAL